MVAVMSMTPVHILGGGHGAAGTLRIVGVVLSVHIAGMYAFSPVMGWLADRYGRTRVIVGGAALQIAACAVAGTAGVGSIGDDRVAAAVAHDEKLAGRHSAGAGEQVVHGHGLGDGQMLVGGKLG